MMIREIFIPFHSVLLALFFFSLNVMGMTYASRLWRFADVTSYFRCNLPDRLAGSKTPSKLEEFPHFADLKFLGSIQHH